MSADPTGYDPDDAQIIPLRPIADRLADEPGEGVDLEKYDTSYEVDLDDPDGEDRVLTGVPVDPTPITAERLPIIPLYLRSWEGMKKAAEQRGGYAWHVFAFHAVRSPLYLPVAVWFALVGVIRLFGRQISWWWRAEAAPLKREAIIDNDALTYSKIDREDRAVRLFRGHILLAEVAAIAATGVILHFSPRWVTLLVAAVAVPILARIGRGSGGPIIGSAVVKARFRKLNGDVVLRAYWAAKLGSPDKDGDQVEFGSRMSRDAMDSGTQVIVDLPYGRTFADVVKAKGPLASGLDVTQYQVFLTPDRTAERRHLLFVADVNPLEVPAGKTPMLDRRERSIWKPAVLGIDEHNRKATFLLMWAAWLVGGQPRKGKTFTMRLLLLWAALDPWVKIFIVDGKSSPDWPAFALVADVMITGTVPTIEDGDPVGRLIDLLKAFKAHIIRVNQLLKKLPPELVPEGKLTAELAKDPRYPELRVWVLAIDEFHLYYETEDQEVNKEVAGLHSFVISQGPSAGVVVIDGSQKPSGVGAGDVGRLFNRNRDNHVGRIAVRCGSRDVSVAVLGGDSYQEGIDASALPVEVRGTGYVYGLTDHVPMVRFHLAEGPDCIVILEAARKRRQELGTLSGEAAGDVVIEGELVDPVADALAVIHTSEPNISWPRLAARLAEEFPTRYADITAAAVSARLRSIGVKGKSVADKEFFPSGRGQGVARAELEAVAARRDVSR